jgi:hypothetical protein
LFLGDDAALASQMVKASQVSGWDTSNHFLEETHYAFQAFFGTDQKQHRLIVGKEPHTAQEEIHTKERIVTLPSALAQFPHFRPYALHRPSATHNLHRVF